MIIIIIIMIIIIIIIIIMTINTYYPKKLHDTLKLLKLSSYLYILVHKEITLKTSHTTYKFLAE
jgi:ABC-type transport system involved in multi-copper enzyme maturation permease subunit